MNLRMQRSTWYFLLGSVLVFAIVQALISMEILSDFWNTIIRTGAVMAIVSLGLNLIYGFNGQFSLGQWGFFAIGAYAAADVTYRWSQMHSASGLVILAFALLLVGLSFILIGRFLSHLPRMDQLSAFGLYLAGVILSVMLAGYIGRIFIDPVTALLNALPEELAGQIVFVIALLLGGTVAAEISFLFGLPVLTLGSDYFGIATLGLTIIVKVLLDNSDTILGFAEMKGARGMVGIPKLTTWFWVFFFLILVIIIARNILHSSVGRAIISVREDEIAAKAMGINIAFFKTLTFVLGSFFAGLGGGLYAHINGFLHPDTFNFIKSFDPMIIIVFGGLGSITGTVGAAFAWALILEGVLRLALPEGFETWRFVIYPVLLLIVMLLRPSGLIGGYELPFLRQIMPPPLRRDQSGSANNSHQSSSATAGKELKTEYSGGSDDSSGIA